jgi:alanine racemase
VLVRGIRVPIVSALSLEHTKLDVTDVSGAAVGDEVVLIGSQGSQTITLGDTAKAANRQVRELLSGFVCKLPYVYFRDGKAVWLSSHLGEVNLAGA